MYQVADNQLIETMDLLNYYSVQSFRNGMVPLLVYTIGRSFGLWTWSWS